MIKITFPDQSVKEFAEGTTPMEIAKNISPRLAQEVLAAKVNGEVWDLTRPLMHDTAIQLLKWDDEDEINSVSKGECSKISTTSIYNK